MGAAAGSRQVSNISDGLRKQDSQVDAHPYLDAWHKFSVSYENRESLKEDYEKWTKSLLLTLGVVSKDMNGLLSDIRRRYPGFEVEFRAYDQHGDKLDEDPIDMSEGKFPLTYEVKLPFASSTEGLTLNGQQLEGPRFYQVGWRENQRFTAEDDPDRTLEPWEPPSFLCKDPLAQRDKLIVEDLELPHLPREQKSSFARFVRGVLDEEDCAELLKHVNQKGFTPALINIGGGMQQLIPEARDGHRVIVDSPQLTDWLLEVVKPHLPETYSGCRLIDLKERCRFLCYTPGQKFEPHCDGCYKRPSGHQNAGDRSKITLQLYLHDVPLQAGGATNFLSNDERSKVRCQPVAGSVLLFTQDLYHEGECLHSGLKYTLRTEAMYRRDRH